MSPVPALTLFFLLFALSAQARPNRYLQLDLRSPRWYLQDGLPHARPQRYLPLGRLPGDVNPFDRYLQQCGENRESNTCGTACPDTCENFLEKTRVCTMQCVIGCQCKKGFVLQGETCVRPEECKGSRKGYLQAGLLPPRLSKLYWQGNPPLVPGAPIWYLQDGLPPPVVNPIGVSKQGDPPLGPPPNANPIGYLGNYAEPPGALPPRPPYMGPIVLPPLGDPKLYLQGIPPLVLPPLGDPKLYLQGNPPQGYLASAQLHYLVCDAKNFDPRDDRTNWNCSEPYVYLPRPSKKPSAKPRSPKLYMQEIDKNDANPPGVKLPPPKPPRPKPPPPKPPRPKPPPLIPPRPKPPQKGPPKPPSPKPRSPKLYMQDIDIPTNPRFLGYSSYYPYGPPPYFPRWDPLYLGDSPYGPPPYFPRWDPLYLGDSPYGPPPAVPPWLLPYPLPGTVA